jgi:hypothetical protein
MLFCDVYSRSFFYRSLSPYTLNNHLTLLLRSSTLLLPAHNKKDTYSGVFSICPATSYSHGRKPPTTIGAKELNDRVRHGNGCDLFAIVTGPTSDKLRISSSTPTLEFLLVFVVFLSSE